jgi:hypothetical protein
MGILGIRGQWVIGYSGKWMNEDTVVGVNNDIKNPSQYLGEKFFRIPEFFRRGGQEFDPNIFLKMIDNS